MEFGAITPVGASLDGWRPRSQGFTIETSSDETKIFKACFKFLETDRLTFQCSTTKDCPLLQTCYN